MRTIAANFTWEILSHGGLKLVLATLSSIALPAMVLTALRHDGAFDPKDQSMITMHVVIACNTMLAIGAALYGAQGRISRLYAYPLRTSSIVAGRVLPAMAIMTVLVALCTATLNLMFHMSWPVLGPALLAAVAMAAVNAFAWLTEKSPIWLGFAMGGISIPIGFWFRSRYGSAFSDPTHYWQLVTPGEAFTMLATSLFAFWVAVKAVARNRRGDPPFCLGLFAWLEQFFDRGNTFGSRPASAFQAQCWFHWQRKGRLIPAAVLFSIFTYLIIWTLGDRTADSLVEAFFAGGWMLSALGLIAGLIFGNIGPNDANYEVGHFLATRPTTDTDAARAVLLTAAKSILLAWMIWALALAVVCVFVVLVAARDAIQFPNGARWWIFPATLLLFWTATANVACLCFFGRSKLLLAVLAVPASVLILLPLLGRFVLTTSAQLFLSQFLQVASSSGLIAVCILTFVAAFQRNLIGPSIAAIATCVWILAPAILLSQLPGHPGVIGALFVVAFAGLLVAPIAAGPLALSINRHR